MKGRPLLWTFCWPNCRQYPWTKSCWHLRLSDYLQSSPTPSFSKYPIQVELNFSAYWKFDTSSCDLNWIQNSPNKMNRATLNLRRFTIVRQPFSVCGYEVWKRNIFSTGKLCLRVSGVEWGGGHFPSYMYLYMETVAEILKGILSVRSTNCPSESFNIAISALQ